MTIRDLKINRIRKKIKYNQWKKAQGFKTEQLELNNHDGKNQ